MKENFFKKIKFFFLATLVVLVAGMTVLGIFGFNQPIDFAGKYEVQITVDQDTKNEKEVVFEYAEKAFDQLNIDPSSYATQVIDNGSVVIYKFSEDVTDMEDEILKVVQAGLDEKGEVKGVKADVKVYETLAPTSSETGWAILALAIAVVFAFVVVAIFNKGVQALALAFSTVLSAILFVALSALVRIPAGAFISFSIAIATVISAVLSTFIVARYKEMRKDPATEREDAGVIAATVFAKDIKKLIMIAIFSLIAVVSMIAVFSPYFMFVAGQLAIAIIVGVASAVFGTPFIYGLLGKKKN